MSLRELTGNNLPNGFPYSTRTISAQTFSFTSSLLIDQFPWPTHLGQANVEFKCTNYPVVLSVNWSSTSMAGDVTWHINNAAQPGVSGSLTVSMAVGDTVTIVLVPSGGGGGGLGTHTYTLSFTAPDPTPVKPKRSYTQPEGGSPSLLAGELAVDVMGKVIYMGREHSDQVGLGPLVVYDSSLANPKNLIARPGQVMLWAGVNAPGLEGEWFRCDGQAINRSIYGNLFAIISTAYGGGDGINTFNLPDLQAPTHLTAPISGYGVNYIIKT